MKHYLACLLLALMAVALAIPALAQDQRKPSVLWVPLTHRGWESTDFPSFQRFARDGFQMDYLESYRLDLARMKKYNVVVFQDLVLYNSTGVEAQLEQTLDLIDQYIEAGGSVWIIPNLDLWGDSVPLLQATQKSLFPRYGMQYLFEQWITDTGLVTAGIWPRNKYAYTTNFAQHPITEGLRGIWYPVDESGRKVPSTTPIRGDENWQVVVSGAPTARSQGPQELNLLGSHFGYPEDVVVEKGYDSAPPILAVREIRQGRMAFMAMNGTFHLMGGSSRGLDGVMMEGQGINNIPNDLFMLFENTFRWLAEPSLASGTVGGYVQDGSRLVEFRPATHVMTPQELLFPAEQPAAQVDMAALEARAKAEGTTGEQLLSRMQGEVPSWRGLIGARSSLSSASESSPAEMIRAAEQAGLDYLVFLENFTAMNAGKLEELKKACAAGTTAEFRAIPGLHIDDNRGHSQFFFGEKLIWPAPMYLTADGKQFDVSARPDSSGIPHIGFMISFAQGQNALGYFNFKSHADSAPYWDLRLYNSMGVTYYRNGQQQEGLADNLRGFLENSDQGCNPVPISVDLVATPEELRQAVAGGHFLTCARTDKLENVMSALWYSYLVQPRAYLSQGPVIKDWDCTNRDATGVGENFITSNYRWRVRCHVTSEVGLAEIKIWDGPRLFRRFVLGGEKDFLRIFEFSHNQQKNLVLEVTDTQGRQAISGEQFDRNQLNYHFWCSDRENGYLYHGPYAFGASVELGPNYAGKGIDTNGNLGVPFKFHPLLVSDKGTEGDRYFNHRAYQWFISEDARHFWEESYKKYPASEKIWMVWGTYGPLIDTDLMTFEQHNITYRVGFNYWPLPEEPAKPDKAWVAPSLFTGKITFKQDQTVQSLMVMNSWTPWDMYKVPNQQVIQAVAHTQEGVTVAAEYLQGFILDGETSLIGPYTIERDGFMAMFGLQPVGSGVVYNLGAPLIFRHDDDSTKLFADLAGKQVKQGDTYSYEFLTLSGRTADNNSLQRYEEIRKYLGLGEGGQPGYDLTLKQGKVLSTRGLLDLQADNGVVSLSIPPPAGPKLHVVLGLRLYGLNSRWDAGLWDAARGKYRPIGSIEDVAYVRLNTELGEGQDVLMGHPVVADNPDVFITFTKLTDQPDTYYCAVNNPTDKPLRVKLTQRMTLPGLAIGDKVVEVPAGGEIVVLR